jgi:hypothetical protein
VTKIFSRLSPLTKSFVSAMLLHILCYGVWGIYYSEFSDRFFTTYVDGSFSGGIAKPIFYNYGFYTALSHLMAVGYNMLPQLNWYGVFSETFMLFATTGFLWIAYAYWHAIAHMRMIAVGLILLLLPFWSYHIVMYRTTELAFLACGIGILGLVVSYLPIVMQRIPKILQVRVFFTIQLILAVFIRLEPTLMCTAIFLPYGLWVARQGQARMGLFKVSLVVLPVFAGAYMLYLGATGPEEKMFRDTRVYTHTLWDFGQDEHLFQLKTAVDSIKLEAAQTFFISDEQALSPEFYESIGVLPLEKSLGSLGDYFVGFNLRVAKAINVWHGLALKQPLFFMAYTLALFFALVLLGLNHQNKKLLLILAMQLWFWAILFGVTVFMKMELRVMAPLLTLGLVSLTLFPILLMPEGWMGRRFNRSFMLLSGMCLLVPAVLKTQELRQSATNYQLGKENMLAFKAELKQPQFEGRIMVFHSFAFQLLYADLFDSNEFAREENFLAIDNGEMYMYPQFKQAMTAYCGGYGVADIANYLVAHKEQVVFVSDSARMDLMERYIETVYAIPFKTKPIYLESIFNRPAGGVMLPEYADHLAFSYFVFE